MADHVWHNGIFIRRELLYELEVGEEAFARQHHVQPAKRQRVEQLMMPLDGWGRKPSTEELYNDAVRRR